jgi:1,4-dihydroxy-2-naphthoate octaprenyltransferase
VPFTLLAFNNLLATTWADRRADAQVGKLTLAIRWSPGHLRALYLALAMASFILLSIYSITLLPPVVALSCVLVLPLVVWGSLDYTRRKSPHASVFAMVAMLLLQIAAWTITPLV